MQGTIFHIVSIVFTGFSENSFEQQFSGEQWCAAEENWSTKRRDTAGREGGSTDSSEEMKILLMYSDDNDYNHD